MRKLAALTIFIALATTACWPLSEWTDRDQPETPPTQSTPVSVDDVEFLYLESYPVQVRAIVRGTLPTPCHQLSWSVELNSSGATVEVTSAIGSDEVCMALVAEPFEIIIDVGDYTSGNYTVTVNGEAFDFTI